MPIRQALGPLLIAGLVYCPAIPSAAEPAPNVGFLAVANSTAPATAEDLPFGDAGHLMENRYRAAIGPGIFLTHGQASIAPTFNLRMGVGPLNRARAIWSVEAGGWYPHNISGDLAKVRQTINGADYTAHIHGLAEAHIAAHYEVPVTRLVSLVAPSGSPAGAPATWDAPAMLDLGFGVSAMQIQNQIDIASPPALLLPHITASESKTAFSPLFQVGIRLLPAPAAMSAGWLDAAEWFRDVSFSFDLAYVGYPNTPSHRAAFDLGLTGWMLRPMLQVRL
jgi:hypothetical protein